MALTFLSLVNLPLFFFAQHFKFFVFYFSHSELLAMPLLCALGIVFFIFDAFIFCRCNTKEIAPSFAPELGAVLFERDKPELFLGLVHLHLHRASTRRVSQSRTSYTVPGFPYYRFPHIRYIFKHTTSHYFTRLF